MRTTKRTFISEVLKTTTMKTKIILAAAEDGAGPLRAEVNKFFDRRKDITTVSHKANSKQESQ